MRELVVTLGQTWGSPPQTGPSDSFQYPYLVQRFVSSEGQPSDRTCQSQRPAALEGTCMVPFSAIVLRSPSRQAGSFSPELEKIDQGQLGTKNSIRVSHHIQVIPLSDL